mmetsp:Transcript_502/g.899  ORF Transcript_502/g.899 Transcript_502/m.899 type:complete len:157 (-) Transcript_502:127-597(-)
MVLHGWLSGKKLPLTVAQLHDIVIEITCCLDLNEDGSRVSFSATTTVWCRSARTDRDVIGRSTLTAFVHPMDFLRAWECCDKEVEDECLAPTAYSNTIRRIKRPSRQGATPRQHRRTHGEMETVGGLRARRQAVRQRGSFRRVSRCRVEASAARQL